MSVCVCVNECVSVNRKRQCFPPGCTWSRALCVKYLLSSLPLSETERGRRKERKTERVRVRRGKEREKQSKRGREKEGEKDRES